MTLTNRQQPYQQSADCCQIKTSVIKRRGIHFMDHPVCYMTHHLQLWQKNRVPAVQHNWSCRHDSSTSAGRTVMLTNHHYRLKLP